MRQPGAGAEREARAWLGSTADDETAYAVAGGGAAVAFGGSWMRAQHGADRVPQRHDQQPAHWEGWEGFRPTGKLCSACNLPESHPGNIKRLF